jgi:peptidoglycan/LPS O-acetylase OafA/YrhL
LNVLRWFPGVPVFFFISGYLISQSWQNIKTDRVRVFASNRFLRLYPALFVCFFITLASIVGSGYIAAQGITIKQIVIWSVAQLTVVQFYNPDFFRGYGIGVVNGNLWTICVELQFYVLTPLVVWMISKRKWLAIVVCLGSLVLHIVNEHFNPRNTVAWKLFAIMFAPWIYMFIVGAYVASNTALRNYLCSLNPYLVLAAALSTGAVSEHFHLGAGNGSTLPAFLALSTLAMNLAYRQPTLANSILKRNDYSYGIYIYHTPVLNFLVYKGFDSTLPTFLLAIAIVAVLAALSWHLIESPALRRKKATLRTH